MFTTKVLGNIIDVEYLIVIIEYYYYNCNKKHVKSLGIGRLMAADHRG